MAELDETPVFIHRNWQETMVVPAWLKEILQLTGLIDEFGILRNVSTEMDRVVEYHERGYHEQ